MNIFILGVSQTGKSTTSKYLSEKYNLTHIQASIMVRNTFKFKESDFKTKQEFIEAITKYSIELNRVSPNPVSDYIIDNYILDNVIIEGIRNPNNFHKLFNIKEDIVIYLDYLNNPVSKTSFEKGLDNIIGYLEWNCEMGILPKERFQKIVFNEYKEIQGLINEKPLLN